MVMVWGNLIFPAVMVFLNTLEEGRSSFGLRGLCHLGMNGWFGNLKHVLDFLLAQESFALVCIFLKDLCLQVDCVVLVYRGYAFVEGVALDRPVLDAFEVCNGQRHMPVLTQRSDELVTGISSLGLYAVVSVCYEHF